MKSRKFFYQNDQREKLYKIGYVKIFSETFVFFVVDYPWNYPEYSMITFEHVAILLVYRYFFGTGVTVYLSYSGLYMKIDISFSLSKDNYVR